MYDPGLFAQKEELKKVAALCAKYDRPLTVHPRANSAVSMSYPELLGRSHLLRAVDELKEIVKLMNGKPFILKGIMTVRGAEKALEAGAAGIVVSNHGGRVLDQCPATAEVLPEIADAVGGQMTILVDGGIRTGMDVFKALALGADGVLIGRPFVTMVYGGGAEGVQVYVDKLQAELADTMAMCGAHALSEISRDMVR